MLSAHNESCCFGSLTNTVSEGKCQRENNYPGSCHPAKGCTFLCPPCPPLDPVHTDTFYVVWLESAHTTLRSISLNTLCGCSSPSFGGLAAPSTSNHCVKTYCAACTFLLLKWERPGFLQWGEQGVDHSRLFHVLAFSLRELDFEDLP